MISNLIISFCGLIGFLTIFLILLRYKTNRITNIYLVLILLIVSIRMLLIGILTTENHLFVIRILQKYNNFLIIIVPSVFLYFFNLIKDKKTFEYKDTIHFIIPIIFNITDYLIDNNYILIYNPKKYYYAFFAAYTLIYLILMFKLLNANIWNRKGEISIVIKQNKLLKQWSLYLYFFFTIIAIRLIVTLFIEIKNDAYYFGASNLWVSAIFWLILYFKIIISPEILYGYSFLNTKINENKKADKPALSFWSIKTTTTITNIQDNQLNTKIEKIIPEYIKTIDQFSFHNAHFRQIGFSLQDVSIKLNIPKSHLTFLFKYHSKISFSDYKKIVRIHDSLALIDEGYLSTNTFDSLAKEVGFKSYNTFFVSFKDYTGVTPHEFLGKMLPS